MGRKKITNRIKQSRQDKARYYREVKARKDPNSVVLTRGEVARSVKKLSVDFQRIMEPHTLSRLQGTKKNSIKDFVAVSAQLGLTHMIVFTQTELGLYMRVSRIPQGPTVTFKIMTYTHSGDVLSALKKSYTHVKMFNFAPCIMTNLQTNEGPPQHQVIARMFLDMFPTITPQKSSPHKIKRCCLLNYDPESELFDFRHYSIRVVPVGICKGVKKLLGRKVPDLGRFTDVSEFITKAGMLSDSEPEDDPSARVSVPVNKVGGGVQLKSSVRLVELGPRMSLKIYKVEAGFLGGQVLHHSFMMKTDEEKVSLENKKRKKKSLKDKRRKEQEAKVEAKKKEKAKHKERCLAGMAIPKGMTKEDPEGKDDEDDDVAYYREEVGEEPDPDFFKQSHKSKDAIGRKKQMKKKYKEIKKKQNERKRRKGNESEDDMEDISFQGKKKKFKKH